METNSKKFDLCEVEEYSKGDNKCTSQCEDCKKLEDEFKQ